MFLLTNEVWERGSEEKLLEMAQKEESRHEKYDSWVWKMRFNAPSSDDVDSFQEMQQRLPEQTVAQKYKLTFGKNKNLAMTENYKVVSAHLHSEGKRVTLLYNQLGSFTFEFETAKSLDQRSLWAGNYDKDNVHCHLRVTQITVENQERQCRTILQQM